MPTPDATLNETRAELVSGWQLHKEIPSPGRRREPQNGSTADRSAVADEFRESQHDRSAVADEFRQSQHDRSAVADEFRESQQSLHEPATRLGRLGEHCYFGELALSARPH